MREKVAGEITPVKVEHSATLNNDEANNAAKRAVDMNYLTQSYTGPGAGGNWYELTLNQIHCVQEVVKYDNTGAPDQTWTCSDNGCSCVGKDCKVFTMTVINEGASSNLSPVSDCKYGNTVTYKRTSGNNFAINEMVIIGKQGINKSRLIFFTFIIYHRNLKCFDSNVLLAC